VSEASKKKFEQLYAELLHSVPCVFRQFAIEKNFPSFLFFTPQFFPEGICLHEPMEWTPLTIIFYMRAGRTAVTRKRILHYIIDLRTGIIRCCLCSGEKLSLRSFGTDEIARTCRGPL